MNNQWRFIYLKYTLFTLLVLILLPLAHADLPLTVDDLLADKIIGQTVYEKCILI